MFKKGKLKYILILALGFFACSSFFLTESTVLANYSNSDFSNLISTSFGNLLMGFGLLFYVITYRKTNRIKDYYILVMILSMISLITFFATKNIILMSICLCIYCFLGTSGFCAGYHFSLITSNVDREYRGRVFAIGYALGSILAYFITLLPNNIFASYISLLIYIPIIVLNLISVINTRNIPSITKKTFF